MRPPPERCAWDAYIKDVPTLWCHKDSKVGKGKNCLNFWLTDRSLHLAVCNEETCVCVCGVRWLRCCQRIFKGNVSLLFSVYRFVGTCVFMLCSVFVYLRPLTFPCRGNVIQLKLRWDQSVIKCLFVQGDSITINPSLTATVCICVCVINMALEHGDKPWTGAGEQGHE